MKCFKDINFDRIYKAVKAMLIAEYAKSAKPKDMIICFILLLAQQKGSFSQMLTAV